MVIKLYHPGLPPSANNAYHNLPRGGRKLTKDGERYKNETMAHFSRNYRREMMTFKKNTPYLVIMEFYFENIENAGWAKGTAETRYKKFDATNRPKLLEDVLKDAAGIDDSQNIEVYLRKRSVEQCPARTNMLVTSNERDLHEVEHVDIFIWDLDKEANPFDAVLRSLA